MKKLITIIFIILSIFGCELEYQQDVSYNVKMTISNSNNCKYKITYTNGVIGIIEEIYNKQKEINFNLTLKPGELREMYFIVENVSGIDYKISSELEVVSDTTYNLNSFDVIYFATDKINKKYILENK